MWWNQTNRNERLQPILSQSVFSLADLLTHLLAIADEASDLARAFYRKSHELEVIRKGDSTPLTDADTGLHHLICERLEALFPSLPILSEESEVAQLEDRLKWPACWVVDPLDGTKEFIKRNGEFTVNIALIANNKPVLGVIYVPVTKTLYYAIVAEQKAYKTILEKHRVAENELFASKDAMSIEKENNETIKVVGSRSHKSAETEAFIQSIEQQGKQVEIVSKGSSLKCCNM